MYEKMRYLSQYSDHVMAWTTKESVFDSWQGQKFFARIAQAVQKRAISWTDGV
jgi:hypothetical protein